MSDNDRTTHLTTGETENIFDEYKQKIREAFDKERDKLKDVAREEAERIVSRANEEATDIISKAKKEAETIVENSRNELNVEANKIIREAHRKAELITREADENTRKKANEKTKGEIAKILSSTREESEKIIMMAQEAAKLESEELTAKAKQEVAKIAAEARAKALEETSKESAKIINMAEQRAAQITANATRLSIEQGQKELDRILSEIQRRLVKDIFGILKDVPQKANQIIDECRSQLNSKSIDWTNLSATISGEPDTLVTTVRQSRPGSRVSSTPQSNLDIWDTGAEKSVAPAQNNTGNEPPVLCEGLMNLEVNGSESSVQRTFIDLLRRLDGVKLMSASGSYDNGGMRYTIFLKAALPVRQIIFDLPVVDSVSIQDRNISVRLKQEGGTRQKEQSDNLLSGLKS